MDERDPLTHLVIGAAIDVSKALGNGVLESAYHAYLLHKLEKKNLRVLSQPTLPIVIDGLRIKHGFRPDMIIEDRLIVELKTITAFQPVHKAQVLTYLCLSGLPVGLLLNFHAYPFSKGIIRVSLSRKGKIT
jgi:GxxExxY protein